VGINVQLILNEGDFMKKVMLIVVMMLSMFVVSEASYRTATVIKNNASYNPSDTNAITIFQRIDACIQANCCKILNGSITKTQLINCSEFSDNLIKEFAKRGKNGNLTQLLWWDFIADPSIGTSNTNVSDATLDTVFLYVVWPTASLIGTGVL